MNNRLRSSLRPTPVTFLDMPKYYFTVAEYEITGIPTFSHLLFVLAKMRKRQNLTDYSCPINAKIYCGRIPLSFVRAFVRSFVRSFVLSFVRSIWYSSLLFSSLLISFPFPCVTYIVLTTHHFNEISFLGFINSFPRRLWDVISDVVVKPFDFQAVVHARIQIYWCRSSIFRHLKLELLTQFPASNDENT